MKKILFLILFAIGFQWSQAQDFQGYAVYESKTSMPNLPGPSDGGREMSPELRKSIEDRMKKMMERTFELHFNKSESLFLEQEKIDPTGNGPAPGMRMMGSMTGGGIVYKDVKTKALIQERDFMGKEFLIQDSLKTIKWEMTGESKMIGGYNCFKATATVEPNKTDFRNIRRSQRDTSEKKSEEKTATDQNKTSTDFLSQISIPNEIQITAWFTPEIPVNQGPAEYWGLPGLILEVNNGTTVILCSKVVLNPKDKKSIKAPKKGKVVTQTEFEKIVMDKLEELRQSRPQGRGMRGMR